MRACAFSFAFCLVRGSIHASPSRPAVNASLTSCIMWSAVDLDATSNSESTYARLTAKRSADEVRETHLRHCAWSFLTPKT